MKLIEKNAALAEIEKLMKEVNPTKDKVGIVGSANAVKYLKDAYSAIDTLEVKEVDSSKIFLAYNEFKKRQPTLVDDLLRKSMREPENERQTIYGEVCDVVGDLYTDLSLKELSAVAKLLIGDYVFRHAYCLQK